MANTPVYPDIPIPFDLPSAIEAIKSLKQAVEALTGSTARVSGTKGASGTGTAEPATTGAVARVWITRKDNPGAPPPVGMFDGDQWFLVPGSDPSDTWTKLIWYNGSWVTTTP